MNIKLKTGQEGVAAIEFALVITTLLLICFAIVSYGMLMWAQQKVSHIAGDSTRVALQQNIQGNTGFAEAACKHAYAMAQADGLLRGGAKALNEVCITTLMYCPLGMPEGTSCSPTKQSGYHAYLQLTMRVKVEGLPLVNLVQSMGDFFNSDSNAWVPDTLSATSVVQINDLSGA